MLDTDTKRRIDTARDILVGKVPDPKSQVEQITIALIYKFMDDMDAESEEMGGTRKFFAGDFIRYGWAKLMRSGLGGHETLNLYAEAIAKMPENSGIPLLFRDIFKNAYLPYRDPETLKAFLKIIDEFSYDHSERLGDAFEYLLSVLGSQGDAGQFRTPRHIIDFMVKVIDPKKNETVLDPACGTAGFLISSYKHILRNNTDAKGNSTLTPDERGRLAENIKGYDISPDMVRLSLVNLYLHGFAAPHIYEYDSLTSQDRWTDYADVILANPPFMSPKGGIKPHNRFSVQSKRSEVLFVDYMAEHLTPNGRAAIIVPEGIIFQSQTAYVQLRKMLVEECLVSVISLPAGVFNPYSGVKTSILILDKALAKQSQNVGFFKVENDGFGLGAQRREIDKNDLPAAAAFLETYLGAARAGAPMDTDAAVPPAALIVPKEKIAANGDYNLSGGRYREGVAQSSAYPHVRLDQVARVTAGNSAPQGDEYFAGGEVSFIRTSDVGAVHLSDNFIGSSDKVNAKAIEELRLELFPAGTILFPKSGASTFLNHRVVMAAPAYVSSHLSCIICDDSKALSKFVYHILCRVDARDITPDQAYPSLRLSEIGAIQIPLPPLEVQKEILAEIEGYQKVIDGARAVVDNYRPHIPVDPDWPMVELGEVCTIRSGGTPDRSIETYWNGDIPWVTTTLIDYGVIERANEFITTEGLKNSATWVVPKGTILMAMYGQGVTRGRVAILGIDAAVNQACAVFQLKGDSVDNGYLFRVLQSRYEDLRKVSDARGGNQSNLSAHVLKSYPIPLPPPKVQKTIVAEIEAEQTLVDANRELITRFERKIQVKLARVWGEDRPAPEEASS